MGKICPCDLADDFASDLVQRGHWHHQCAQVFVVPLVMTGGGPGRSTYFFAMYVYDQAFQYGDMGYASVLGLVQFAAILVLTGLVLLLGQRFVYYRGADGKNSHHLGLRLAHVGDGRRIVSHWVHAADRRGEGEQLPKGADALPRDRRRDARQLGQQSGHGDDRWHAGLPRFISATHCWWPFWRSAARWFPARWWRMPLPGCDGRAASHSSC